MAGTKAGKAIVEFAGDFEGLASGAKSAIGGIGEHITNTLGGAFSSVARTGTAAFAGISLAAVGFFGKSILAAARVDELNITLDALAKANNLSAASLHSAAAGVKAMGIETAVADQTIAKFVQSHLDVSKAADLARVAQDAAVISGQNSTDVTAQLIQGIQTQQVETLRSAGVTIDGQKAFKDYAASIHVSVGALTSAQKQQAYLNAVLVQGIAIQGTYEAAMQSPSKMLRSFPRLFDDISISVGQSFTPALANIIGPAYKVVKAFDMLLQSGGGFAPVLAQLGLKAKEATAGIAPLADKLIAWMKTADYSKVTDLFGTMSKFLPLIAGLGGAMGAFGASNIPFIGQFLKINPVLAAIVGVVAASPQLRDALSGIFQQLMPLVNTLVKAATPILQTVLQTIATLLIALMPPLMKIATVLIDVIVKVMAILAPIVAKILNTLGPIIAKLVTALVPVIEALEPVLIQLATIIGEIVDALLPALPALADLVIMLLPLLVDLIKGVGLALKILEPVLIFLAQTLTNIILGIDWFFNNLGTVKVKLGDLAGAIGQWFQNLPANILSWIMMLPGALADAATWIITTLIQGMIAANIFIIKFIAGIPQFMFDTFLTLAVDIPKIGVWLIITIVQGLISGLPKVLEFLAVTLPLFMITKALPAMAEKILALAVGIIAAIAKGLGDSPKALLDWFAGIPKMLLDNAAKMGQAFKDFGNWLWNKIIDGIPGLHALIDAVIGGHAGGNIAQSIIDAVNKNAAAAAAAASQSGNSPAFHAAALGGMQLGPTIVGEQGRELAFFPQPTMVIPHDLTEQLLAGNRQINITIVAQTNADPQQIAREAAWLLRTNS